MILVLLGTQHNDFHRLLQEIDRNIENGEIKEEVVVQAGFTKYSSDNMKIFNVVPKDELEKMVENADLIITHAGVGSIEMSLEKGKKVITVPRLKKYGEHVNDHQIEIEKEFNNEGWLIGVDDVEDLDKALIRAKGFKPKKYEVDSSRMVNIIKTFIDKI